MEALHESSGASTKGARFRPVPMALGVAPGPRAGRGLSDVGAGGAQVRYTVPWIRCEAVRAPLGAEQGLVGAVVDRCGPAHLGPSGVFRRRARPLRTGRVPLPNLPRRRPARAHRPQLAATHRPGLALGGPPRQRIHPTTRRPLAHLKIPSTLTTRRPRKPAPGRTSGHPPCPQLEIAHRRPSEDQQLVNPWWRERSRLGPRVGNP